jgi:hypothetical protein
MKRKTQKILLCIGFLTALSLAAFFTTCDMVRIDDSVSQNLGKGSGSGSRELTEKERDELEKNGHFLKLINMPLNTQVPNVFSVSVANSSAAVGKFKKENIISIFKESDTCTVYLPLVYNDDSEFWETGFFYTAFTIHVDALSKYIVEISDCFVVSYTDGRGQADVNKLPSSITASYEPRYLTIFNLPSSTSVQNFAGVFVHDQKGAVAKCSDYSQILLSVNDDKTTAKIPLHYNSVQQIFTETGVFYVLFDINVDVETRYTLTKNDQIKVTFINGNGILDIQNIPDNPVPYLTLKGLPLNATKQQVSDVNVYNLASSVAGSTNYNNIVVFKDNEFSTFLLPLSYSSGTGYFHDTGRFAVSFTINVDIDTQITFTRDDNLILPFFEGSAEFDINSFFGFFDASLTNPNDSAKPIIKAGSSFDVNGNRHSINSDYSVTALTPSSSCVLYLYAFYADADISYEFSATAPKYDSKRKGWYNNTKRALWKMIYLSNTSPYQFLFKTYIGDDFPQLGTAVLANDKDYPQIISSRPITKSISGASNPPSETITLDPGVYVFELKGAGGGGGRAYNSTSSGGAGGLVREIVTLNSVTTFTTFTGSGGETAPDITSTSGTFDIITTYNFMSFDITGNLYHAQEAVFTAAVEKILTIKGTDNKMSGGGGGGGGSGTFIYSSTSTGNYLLIAGGGSGGSGGSYLTPGGGGGAGGSISPGAGGGCSGTFSQSNKLVNGVIYTTGNWTSSHAPGGAGGGSVGFEGGSGGRAGSNGNDAVPFLHPSRFNVGLGGVTPNGQQTGGSSSSYYSTADLSFYPYIPFLYYPSGNTPAPIRNQSTTYIFNNNSVFTTTYGSSGGKTPVFSFSRTDPNAWLNTTEVGGPGASAPALSKDIFTGRVSTSPAYPGMPNSAGNLLPGWFLLERNFSTSLTMTIPASPPNAGNPGGNNRNSTRGGGAASGAAGSITIHKIY